MKTETLIERRKGQWKVDTFSNFKLAVTSTAPDYDGHGYRNILIMSAVDEQQSEQDKANAAFICRAVNNYDKVVRLLEDLTPGGSEFYDDPEYCAKWIKESREENHYTLTGIIKKSKQENEKLKAINDSLLNALKLAKDELEEWYQNNYDNIDSFIGEDKHCQEGRTETVKIVLSKVKEAIKKAT